MLFTYIFYCCLLSYMILGSIVLNKISKKGHLTEFDFKYFYILAIPYSLLIGLRHNVGVDYNAYLLWYRQFKSSGYFPVPNSDFGYVAFNKLLIQIDADYVWLFIGIAFFQIYFLLKSLSKTPFILPWYFFFFFTSLFMFSSMNIMRQTITYFCFFYCLILFLEKKYLPLALTFLFGLSMHKSILFFIWVFPLIRFDWFKNRYAQILILFLFTFFAENLLTIITQRISVFVDLLGYSYYLNNIDEMKEITKNTAVGAGFGKFLFFIVDAIIIYHSKKLKALYASFNFKEFYNLYFLGALLIPVFSSNFILSRTNDYLSNFRVLILSFTCFYLFNTIKKQPRNIYFLLIIATGMLMYFFRGIDNSAAKCSPFNFVFDM